MMASPPASSRFRWFAGLAGLFLLLTLPLILTERETNYTFDETSYHLPAIRQIREHWPRLDLQRDSLSATAPGYQYVLAGLSLVIGPQRLPLRMANLAVSLGVLILLWRAWPAGTDPRGAALALLPLAACNFFVKSAACIVTDNAALLTITGTLAALLFAPAGRGLFRASGLAAATVLIRQSGVWLVAPLTTHILREPRRSYRLLFVLPPLAALAWLVMTWGGLVPPVWRDLTHPATGLVPAAGAYLFGVLAIFGAGFYAAARPPVWTDDLLSRWAAAGAVIGLGLALAGPNTLDHDAGRWGGYLWDLAARLPSLGRYSPVFLVLAPIGGALLGVLARRLWQEAGPAATLTWLAAFAGWLGTMLVNRQVFHRYYEPTLLVMLICWLLLLVRARGATCRLDVRPLAVLGLAQVLLTLLTAHARTFGFL